MKKWWSVAIATCLISSTVLPSVQATQVYASEKTTENKTEDNKEKKETKTAKEGNYPSYAKGNYPYADQLPEWDDDFWRYVNDNDPNGFRDWNRGMAYPYKDQFEHLSPFWHGIIGGEPAYQEAVKKVNADDYTKNEGVRILIMYKPRCPYTKRYLPTFKYLAEKAGAKVLLADADVYPSGTLLPWMPDVTTTGLRLPGAIYLDKNKKLKGVSGIEGAEGFAKILDECGYEVKDVPKDDKYTTEDVYKRDELIETNKERIAKGQLPLSTFKDVEKVADLRAKEIVTKVEHTRPNGTSYATALQEANIKGPNWYGENIAAGPGVADPWSVNDAWMNSRPHRENILNSKFTHIGIGHYKNTEDTSKYFQDHWAQLFLGKCDIESMSLDTQGLTVMKGAPLVDQDVTVTLHCKTHGDTTMPLIDEMTTGYDPQKEGEQSVTVHYGNKTQRLMVNVGNKEPEPLKPEMIDINFDLARNKKQAKAKEEIAEFGYTGQAQRPEVQVSNPTGEYPLIEGYSYDIRYENNIEVGTAKVIVTGKGNYKGTVEKEFKIVPHNLTGKVEIKGINDSYEYIGKPITPTVTATIKDGNIPLYQGADFDVEYKDNTGTLIKKPGYAVTLDDKPATVTVKGKGNYIFEETNQFKFTMSTRQKAAETLAFVIGPAQNSGYKDVTAMLDKFKEWQTTGSTTAHKQRFKTYMEQTYETIIEYSKSLGENKKFDISGSFDSKKEQLAEAAKDPDTKKGYQEMMTESLSPKTAKYVNQWIEYVQKERKVSEQVEAPKVENDAVQGITVDGLESMITANNSSNANENKIQLEVKKPATTPTIDSEKYDVVDAVPVQLDVKFGDTEKEITQPITVKMDIPKGFDTNNEFVALRETTSKRSSELEEISVVVDKENNKMSFTTTKTGNFVLTQKLPTYEVEQTLQPANNPAESGVSFGEASNEGPAAATDLKVYRDKDQKIHVSWKAPELKEGWTLDGYTVNFSQNEDMSEAQHINISKDKTSTMLDKLPAGKYYFTVTTNASSDWTDYATRDSLITLLDIPGETTEVFNPTYQVVTKDSDHGTLAVNVVKATKDSSTTVQKGDTIKVTATPDEDYFTSKVNITNTEGNEIQVIKDGDVYTFTMPASDITVTALFGKKEVPVTMKKVTANSVENGGFIFDDSQFINGKAVVGERIEFQAVANKGYKVDTVTVKTTSGKTVEVKHTTGDKYAFVMPNEDVTIDAKFVKSATSEAMKENVVAIKDIQLYSDIELTKKKGTLENNHMLQVQRLYTVANGKQVYSLYDIESGNKAVWKGYAAKEDIKKLTSVDMKDINVTVTKEKPYTLWKDFFYNEKKGTTKQGQVYKATRYYDVNGARYYSLYKTNKDGKDEWQGYVNKNAIRELKAEKVNKVYVVNKDYTCWSNFYWTQKRGITKDYMNQAVNVKYQYTIGNGSRYYSVYDKDDRWLGYVNNNAFGTLKSVDMKDMNVTVTKEKPYTLWKDFLYKEKKGATKHGQVYKATRYYDVNGARYYSLYKTNKDGKDEWQGYVNKNAVRELKAEKVNKTKKVVKDYTLWSNFYWTKKRGTTKDYMNKKVMVKYQYTIGNGSRYYSIYDQNNRWLGYANANSCR